MNITTRRCHISHQGGRCSFWGTKEELRTHVALVQHDPCSAPGCTKNAEFDRRRLLCSMHQARISRHGTFEGKRPQGVPLAERFHRYIEEQPNGCWLWTGGKSDQGYGIFFVGLGNPLVPHRPQVYAHRWAYFQSHGPLAAALEVMHSCDNPPCVNPAHLSLGTTADNARDRIRKGRRSTTCKQGHPWTDENTRYFIDSKGNTNRRCRTCRRQRESRQGSPR